MLYYEVSHGSENMKWAAIKKKKKSNSSNLGMSV